jgi:outer membrane lipoprotein SlyB
MAAFESKTHPIVIIAAVAVIVFCVLAIGMMTGYIPSSFSKSSPADEQGAMPSSASLPSSASPATKEHTASAPRPQHQAVAANEEPRSAPAAAHTCVGCGRIEAINTVEQKGEGSGLGAVAGGVAGGLLGNQIGNGRGNTLATIAGVAGGALAGNEVEKRVKSTKQYSVAVRMDDGTSRTFSFQAEPAFSVGERVKVVDGKLAAAD